MQVAHSTLLVKQVCSCVSRASHEICANQFLLQEELRTLRDAKPPKGRSLLDKLTFDSGDRNEVALLRQQVASLQKEVQEKDQTITALEKKMPSEKMLMSLVKATKEYATVRQLPFLFE